jgi:hypothetical protein
MVNHDIEPANIVEKQSPSHLANGNNMNIQEQLEKIEGVGLIINNMKKIYFGNGDDAGLIYKPVLLPQKELSENIERARSVIDSLYNTPWYAWFKRMSRIKNLNLIRNELGTHTNCLIINK